MTGDHHIAVYFGDETTPLWHYRVSAEAAHGFAATIHSAGVGRVSIDDRVVAGMPRMPLEALWTLRN